MKTREEYLFSFEEKTLGAVSSVFTSMDRNLILSYSLSVALVIFNWDKATEFTLLGAKISVGPDQIYHFLPLLVSLIYLPISYQLYRIIGIYRALKNNGEELHKLNADARPITLTDMRHFESGVAGLILALARWQATALLVNNPFASSDFSVQSGMFSLVMKLFRWFYELSSWAVRVLTRLTAILALFFLPLVVCGIFLFDQFLSTLPIEDYFAALVLVCVLLSAFVTLWFGAILFLVYFLELLNEVKGDFEQSAKRLTNAITGVVSKKLVNSILKGPIWPFM